MNKLLAILLCITFTSNGMATEPSLPIPQDFMFRGKPIQPACIDKFFGDSSSDQPIHLDRDACQTKKQALDPHPPKGFLGHTSSDGSYIYYEHLGTISLKDLKKYLSSTHLKDLKEPFYHLIYTRWSGGGTGQFTSIYVIEKSGNILRLVDAITGGDRCNGGVLDVDYKDGVLTYKQNVTPWGLYALIHKDPTENFLDCAVCCLGQVTYRWLEITSFTFKSEAYKALEADSGSPQVCYNQIIKETLAKGKSTLTFEELESFIQNIKEQCVDKKTPSSS